MGTDRLGSLADRSLSYSEVGATGVALPEGYRHLARNEVVGSGSAAFASAAELLMTWRMHERAGLRVRASSPRATPGSNVLLEMGPTWRALEAPCRVLHAVDQADRIGFTYGTLHGHPMQGEESFSVLIDDDATVRFVLIAFSRPCTVLARFGSPIGNLMQTKLVDRYVSAVRDAATSGGDAG